MFLCNLCPDVYTSEDLMKNHLKTSHPNFVPKGVASSPSNATLTNSKLMGCKVCTHNYLKDSGLMPGSVDTDVELRSESDVIQN